MAILSENDLEDFMAVTFTTDQSVAAGRTIAVVESALRRELGSPLQPSVYTDETYRFTDFEDTEPGLLLVPNHMPLDPSYDSNKLDIAGTLLTEDSNYYVEEWGFVLVSGSFANTLTVPAVVTVSYRAGIPTRYTTDLESCLLPACARIMGQVIDGTLSVEQVSEGGESIRPEKGGRQSLAGQGVSSFFTLSEWGPVSGLSRPYR